MRLISKHLRFIDPSVLPFLKAGHISDVKPDPRIGEPEELLFSILYSYNPLFSLHFHAVAGFYCFDGIPIKRVHDGKIHC